MSATLEPLQILMEMSGVMDRIIRIVQQETELVRAGKLGDAARLEPQKTEYTQHYYAGASRIQAMLPQLRAAVPDALVELQRKHDEFRALLQINLTVLATAHAVSEGIMRGVSDELARKTAPSTYGASGRTNAPGANAHQPLAVSRVL
jgi:hypothetical protein